MELPKAVYDIQLASGSTFGEYAKHNDVMQNKAPLQDLVYAWEDKLFSIKKAMSTFPEDKYYERFVLITQILDFLACCKDNEINSFFSG